MQESTLANVAVKTILVVDCISVLAIVHTAEFQVVDSDHNQAELDRCIC